MFNLQTLLCGFFEWNIDRLKNPFVISGLVVVVLGVILLCFSNPLAYKITTKMKNASDELLANVGITIKVISLVIVIIGCLLAVLFV